MKSGNLNFLEPSGPLQVCNGTALPLPVYVLSTNESRGRLVGIPALWSGMSRIEISTRTGFAYKFA